MMKHIKQKFERARKLDADLDFTIVQVGGLG